MVLSIMLPIIAVLQKNKIRGVTIDPTFLENEKKPYQLCIYRTINKENFSRTFRK